MSKIFIPGMALGRLDDSAIAMWTVIMYEMRDGVFRECMFRRFECEAQEDAPYDALRRLLRELAPRNNEYVLLFECPTCGSVSEMEVARTYSACYDCGAYWFTRHAVAEMCYEHFNLLKTGEALRERMVRLAGKLGAAVGKPLF